MNTMIIKLNATGDVVRTSTLLHRYSESVTWLTAAPNHELLPQTATVRVFDWSERERALDRNYDLLINLEDDVAQAAFACEVPHHRLFGAYVDENDAVAYSHDSRSWFDLSLISAHGRERADELKLRNRRSYQDLIFSGLGLTFTGEPYMLPPAVATPLSGDVALAPVAGPVWPMKGWAYYEQLKSALESAGLQVNVLPRRSSLREHLADVAQHRCLVSGDSLPMHLALGSGTPCVTLFNCTSPWEIHDYGIQTKIVSPLLDRFFYKRGLDPEATSAIGLDVVFDAVVATLRQHAEVAI